jgi:hypothetical protein
MKTFVFAYLGGLAASAPAFAMFNDVGASPWRNFEAVYAKTSGSLQSILIYFALIWIVPAFGSALGAKIGGRQAEFHYIYGRGIGGQVAFSLLFTALLTLVPTVGTTVFGLSTPMQTIVFLMAAQIGCAFGTVWGY